MWHEQFAGACKSLKLSVDGAQKICELTFDLGEFPSELAYGLPSGLAQLKLLRDGDLSQVKFTPDGEQFIFKASYLGDRVMLVHHAKIKEVVLSSRQKDDEEPSVEGKVVVRFFWSPEDLLFFAESLSHEMAMTLVEEQTDLPLSESPGVMRAAKKLQTTMAEHGATMSVNGNTVTFDIDKKAKA